MTRKTYRVKLLLDGDNKPRVYRTDGVPTHCCSFQIDYFIWEKNTQYNNYDGYSGYISAGMLKSAIDKYNPDNLTL